ncbi:hypothetical protein KQI65_09775 [bacterium]|nr:hypothetical protein [bacterium]
MTKRDFAWVATVALLLAVLPVHLDAQPVWMQPRHDNQISVEWFKPIAPSGSENNFMSGTYFIDMIFELDQGMKIVSEVPFVYTSGTWKVTPEYTGETTVLEQSREYTQTLVGNIYAGLEIGSEEREFYFEVGTRLPTTGSMIPPEQDNAEQDGYWEYLSYLNAIMIGLWSDIERYGAFRPLGVSGDARYVTAQALVNYRPPSTEWGITARFRGGPQFFIPTAHGNLEVGLSVTAQASYQLGRLFFLVGYSGLAAITAENFGIKDGLAHHLVFGMSLDLGDVYPGIQVRLPLDNNGSDFFQNCIVFQVGFLAE